MSFMLLGHSKELLKLLKAHADVNMSLVAKSQQVSTKIRSQSASAIVSLSQYLALGLGLGATLTVSTNAYAHNMYASPESAAHHQFLYAQAQLGQELSAEGNFISSQASYNLALQASPDLGSEQALGLTSPTSFELSLLLSHNSLSSERDLIATDAASAGTADTRADDASTDAATTDAGAASAVSSAAADGEAAAQGMMAKEDDDNGSLLKSGPSLVELIPEDQAKTGDALAATPNNMGLEGAAQVDNMDITPPEDVAGAKTLAEQGQGERGLAKEVAAQDESLIKAKHSTLKVELDKLNEIAHAKVHAILGMGTDNDDLDACLQMLLHSEQRSILADGIFDELDLAHCLKAMEKRAKIQHEKENQKLLLKIQAFEQTIAQAKSSQDRDGKDLYTKLLGAKHKLQLSSQLDATRYDSALVKDARKCPQGKRWKIAVNQSGPFSDFRKVFRGMVSILMDEGLIRKYDPVYRPDYAFDAPGAFDELAKATKGGCIEFVPGSFNSYDWERKGVYLDKIAIKRLIDRKQIDMIWAFGTISGLYYADSDLKVPVLVIDATSPVDAGIIGPGNYSDKPNIHVQKDRTRYSAEVVLFHNLLKFKRMGILVDSSEDNQSGQDIFEIRSLAQKMGFELVPCYGDIMGRNLKQADADFKRCLTTLAKEDLDALFLTLVYRPKEPLFPLIKPFIDRGIPIYSQYGDTDVRNGALLSLSESDMIHASIFEADVVKQIIVQGKKPEQISQIYHAPLSLSLNMHTARLIEWQPSFEALIAVDNVYTSIENGETCQGYNTQIHSSPDPAPAAEQ